MIDEECSECLYKRKPVKLQGLQDSRQINVESEQC